MADVGRNREVGTLRNLGLAVRRDLFPTLPPVVGDKEGGRSAAAARKQSLRVPGVDRERPDIAFNQPI
jgi:hypothetical protein